MIGRKKRKGEEEGYLLNNSRHANRFREQLSTFGLTLRDVRGDGSCMFRALGDQLGQPDSHMRLRQETVQFMSDHRDDFAPFIEDSMTFDQYLEALGKQGTYADQDALVAFSRARRVTIVIHQHNSPLWQIPGGDPGSPELHIAYHNGEHYSSVRRLGDSTDGPAGLHLNADLTGILPADPSTHLSSTISTNSTPFPSATSHTSTSPYPVSPTTSLHLRAPSSKNRDAHHSDSNSVEADMLQAFLDLSSASTLKASKSLPGFENELRQAMAASVAGSDVCVAASRSADEEMLAKAMAMSMAPRESRKVVEGSVVRDSDTEWWEAGCGSEEEMAKALKMSMADSEAEVDEGMVRVSKTGWWWDGDGGSGSEEALEKALKTSMGVESPDSVNATCGDEDEKLYVASEMKVEHADLEYVCEQSLCPDASLALYAILTHYDVDLAIDFLINRQLFNNLLPPYPDDRPEKTRDEDEDKDEDESDDDSTLSDHSVLSFSARDTALLCFG